MVIAALGDIHGNAPALEAALRDIDEAGIRTIVCTGDLVAGYSFPNEVINIIEQRNIPTAQGLQDKLTAALVRSSGNALKRASEEDAAAMRWAYDHLTSANIEYLRALPKVLRLTVDGFDIYVCHGAPDAVNEGIGEETSAARFDRYRESARADIVIGGMTHEPFHRLVDDTLFVNPGSVGCDDRGAAYAVISTEDEPWSVEYRFAKYDREAADEPAT